jgi:hypothetical protein
VLRDASTAPEVCPLSLFLIEQPIPSNERPTDVVSIIVKTVESSGGEVVESRTTASGEIAFIVVEHHDAGSLEADLSGAGFDADIALVRLVGADLEIVKSRTGGNYLVEWDLPDGLDMDTYLARKAEKSPLYDQVPEVRFERTYVREDMGKCLCFYEAGCEDDVRHAREVVATPVDRLHELDR